MDVVGHEAVGGNLEVGLLAASVEEVEIEEVVAVFEEDLLAGVAPLGDRVCLRRRFVALVMEFWDEGGDSQ